MARGLDADPATEVHVDVPVRVLDEGTFRERERLRGPRWRDRRPDRGPSSALSHPGRERRTGSTDAHLLHGGDVCALHRPGGADGGDLSARPDEIDLPQ